MIKIYPFNYTIYIMLSFDQYQCEFRYFLDLLKESVKKREEELMVIYIQQGPEVLRAKVGAKTDESMRMVFDRLVFTDDVLMKCVMNFMPFFKSMVAENGPLVLRKIFAIESARYNPVFEKLFDLVAVANGALFDYAYRNRTELAARIMRGDGGEIRKMLCLTGRRYDALWGEILRMLIDCVCDSILADRMNKDGIQALMKLFEAARGDL